MPFERLVEARGRLVALKFAATPSESLCGLETWLTRRRPGRSGNLTRGKRENRSDMRELVFAQRRSQFSPELLLTIDLRLAAKQVGHDVAADITVGGALEENLSV